MPIPSLIPEGLRRAPQTAICAFLPAATRQKCHIRRTTSELERVCEQNEGKRLRAESSLRSCGEFVVSGLRHHYAAYAEAACSLHTGLRPAELKSLRPRLDQTIEYQAHIQPGQTRSTSCGLQFGQLPAAVNHPQIPARRVVLRTRRELALSRSRQPGFEVLFRA